ncbi:hypothetical protein CspeluHIS016_0306570 [Cutaneotrichosporon spelunceum]|uniref:Uncharacterized protein n=1 Tax=Cutaneotrichosporon spelunceum TaxID=1672016 RepID=A0AAD3TUL6_9TREE|nr:hypothetical protein CspeluHIS016_0306570 [Cutaneotrichosporon spelunceum]
MSLYPPRTLPQLRAHIYNLNLQITKNNEKVDDLERYSACSATREYAREAIEHANSVNRLIIVELQNTMWQITESWRIPSGSPDSVSDSGSDEEGGFQAIKERKQVRWADDLELGL